MAQRGLALPTLALSGLAQGCRGALGTALQHPGDLSQSHAALLRQCPRLRHPGAESVLRREDAVLFLSRTRLGSDVLYGVNQSSAGFKAGEIGNAQ